MKQVIILFACAILGHSSFAQKFTGLWHGYITARDYASSNYILHVKEQKGKIIKGRGYLYYGVNEIKGWFDLIGTIEGSNCKITELTIIESRTPADSIVMCVKYLNLALNKIENTETLTGQWNGSTVSGVVCNPGGVYLQRYTLTDSVQKNPIPPALTELINKDISLKMSFLKTELTPPIILNVARTTVKLDVKDYMKEDNDSVSVYLNRSCIIKDLLIRKKSHRTTIHLNKLSGLNEIIVYAENLGRIPPNTCILTVDDGVSKQSVNISSSMQTSAVIYLNYLPSQAKVAPTKPVERNEIPAKIPQPDQVPLTPTSRLEPVTPVF